MRPPANRRPGTGRSQVQCRPEYKFLKGLPSLQIIHIADQVAVVVEEDGTDAYAIRSTATTGIPWMRIKLVDVARLL
jgi:hypothetical protein